ncbi:hypothetical protein AHAS_Ahas17G0152100 [Arachis hypogaea]
MARLPEQIRPYLRRVGFEYMAYMVEPLVSVLIERWRSESHTFHLPCGDMTITLQDVAYQLGLRIDGDPMSGCIGGWEKHHQGRTIEELYASDSRVHIRWLPLLEDLETCGRLSWGSAMLAWMYRQMCRAMEHGQRNLGVCVNLLLSWAYHHILLVRSDSFDTRRLVTKVILHTSLDNPDADCWIGFDHHENVLRNHLRIQPTMVLPPLKFVCKYENQCIS